MGGRNTVCEALVLRTRPVGELHRSVSLLTREGGLMEALAHGAQKSRGILRNLTHPFVHGRIYIYTDPVKKVHSIKDMEEGQSFAGLMEDLGRYYWASLAAEFTLGSFASGADSQAFDLFLLALGAWDAAQGELVDRVGLQFFVRSLEILGMGPEWGRCPQCGASRRGLDFVYSNREGTLVCQACSRPQDRPLDAGALDYIRATADLDWEPALAQGLDQATLDRIKGVIFPWMQDIVGRPLRTLESAGGILF